MVEADVATPAEADVAAPVEADAAASVGANATAPAKVDDTHRVVPPVEVEATTETPMHLQDLDLGIPP